MLKQRLNVSDQPGLDKNLVLRHNIKVILLYSLCLLVALGINQLVTTIFQKITNVNSGLWYQFFYVIMLFIITIVITYRLDTEISI